jgi:hypothetical protein
LSIVESTRRVATGGSTSTMAQTGRVPLTLRYRSGSITTITSVVSGS